MTWFYIRLGQIGLAHTAAEQELMVLERLGFPEIPNDHTHDPSLPRNLVASIQGDYVQAEALAQQALECSHKLDYYQRNQHTAKHILATIAFTNGQYDTARRRPIRRLCPTPSPAPAIGWRPYFCPDVGGEGDLPVDCNLYGFHT